MIYPRDNTIFLGDSFELLYDMPDNSVDVILTDPPYDFSRPQMEQLYDQFLRICDNGTIIIFFPPENPWPIYSKEYEFLFWMKPISTKNTSKHYSRFVEMIRVDRLKNSIWNNNRHWSQYTNVFSDLVDDSNIHPYRKPLSLLSRLIQNHSNAGSKIFDPFCGSGSVGEASKLLQRRFCGIELLETWKSRYEECGFSVL